MTKTLGHIDCPACGTAGGMRVTIDKNGHPFGFCETKCRLQMRVGGDPYRVALFVARYPWASADPVTVSVPVTEPEQAPKPVTAPAAAPATPPAAKAKQPAPPPAPKPAKAEWFSTILGAKNG